LYLDTCHVSQGVSIVMISLESAAEKRYDEGKLMAIATNQHRLRWLEQPLNAAGRKEEGQQRVECPSDWKWQECWPTDEHLKVVFVGDAVMVIIRDDERMAELSKAGVELDQELAALIELGRQDAAADLTSSPSL
jgi:hypothetical protein